MTERKHTLPFHYFTLALFRTTWFVNIKKSHKAAVAFFLAFVFSISLLGYHIPYNEGGDKSSQFLFPADISGFVTFRNSEVDSHASPTLVKSGFAFQDRFTFLFTLRYNLLGRAPIGFVVLPYQFLCLRVSIFINAP